MRKLLVSEHFLIAGLIISFVISLYIHILYFFLFLGPLLMIVIGIYFIERYLFNFESIPYVLAGDERKKLLDKNFLWNQDVDKSSAKQKRFGKIIVSVFIVLTLPGMIFYIYSFFIGRLNFVDAVSFWFTFHSPFLFFMFLGVFLIFYRNTNRNTVAVLKEGLFFDKYFIPWDKIKEIYFESDKSEFLSSAAQVSMSLFRTRMPRVDTYPSTVITDKNNKVFRVGIKDRNAFIGALEKINRDDLII